MPEVNVLELQGVPKTTQALIGWMGTVSPEPIPGSNTRRSPSQGGARWEGSHPTGEEAKTLTLSSLLTSLPVTLLSLKFFNNGIKNYQVNDYNIKNVF